MPAKGKSKQLASEPPGGYAPASKLRRGGRAGFSSSYLAAGKRRRTGVFRFFDEDESEPEKDFHEDDGLFTEEKGKRVNNKRTERSHPHPYFGGHQNLEKLSGDELEKFVKDEEFTHLNEPIIWRVKCMVGCERQMAFSFMQKFVDTKVPIISAFSLDHVRGFVFVEAEKACDVTEACKGFCNLYVNRISPVPTAEVPSLLSPRTKPFQVSSGTWERIKTSNYKGDDDDARPSSRVLRPRPRMGLNTERKRKRDNNRSSKRSHPLPFLGYEKEEELRMRGDELKESSSNGKNSILQEAPATHDEPAIPTAATISGFFTAKRRKSDNNTSTKRSHPLPFLGGVKEEEQSGDELKESLSKGSSILGQWVSPPGDTTTGEGGSVGGGSWGKSNTDKAFSQGKSSCGSNKNDSSGAPPKQSGGDDQVGKKDGNNTWSHKKPSSGGGSSIPGAPLADTTSGRGGSSEKGNEDGWNSSKETGGSGLNTERKRKSDNDKISKRSHPPTFFGHEKEEELRMRGDELEESSSKGKNSLLQEAPATHDEPAISTAGTISGFFSEKRRKRDTKKRTNRSHPRPLLGHIKEEELSGNELEESSSEGKNLLLQEAPATCDEPGEEEQDQAVGDTTASPSPAARVCSPLDPAEEDIPLNTELLLKIQDNQQKILLKLQDNQQKILKNQVELENHGKHLKLIQHDMDKLVKVAREFENDARQILNAILRKL